ncbi:beta strand repeat-containing protein [Roseovarius tibetensis]|uniref:beta strand repeat-containing protein n=1 Tax=Roseovarius tibetensis TaxID=2685897 RepID=UPI003D7F9B39
MTTFTLTGFSIGYDTNEKPVSIGTASLTVTFPNDQAVLNYSIVDATDPTDLPTVALGGTDDLGATINNTPISDNAEEFLGEITTTEGTHTLLAFYDPANNQDFIFQIGGDPLTPPATPADVETLVLSTGPARGALGPDQDILFTSLLGVPTISSSENDTIIVDNDEFFEVEGGQGDDTIDMSGLSTSDGYVELLYGGLAGAITVDIDGTANTGSVVKSGVGTDTLVNVENPLFAGWTLGGLLVEGTAAGDTFNLDLADQQWMEIRPGAGQDQIALTGNGIVRLDFRDAANGIDVDLRSNSINDDGYGNTEIISGNTPWGIRGSTHDDVFIGSDGDDRFRKTGGNDDVHGGTGFDRLRYESSLVESVNINAADGTATGMLTNGSTFSDTFSGFEWLRGSSGNDMIFGDGSNNRLEGRDGDDTVGGGFGDDFINLQGGADTYVYSGGNDIIADFDVNHDSILINIQGVTQQDVENAFANSSFFSDPGGAGNRQLVGFAPGESLGFVGLDATAVANINVATGDGGLPTPSRTIGTIGDDVLIGTPGNDQIVTGDASPSGDVVIGTEGNDTIDLSGMNQSTAFLFVTYENLGSAITVDIDGAANTATVNKGVLGLDTLLNIENPLIAGFNLGGLGIAGTAQADTFNLDPGADQWMQARGGEGADSYDIGDTGFVRLGFAFIGATQGAEIDLGLSTGQIINDGFGNTETITGPGTVWEIRGTENGDLITGSGADESFISQQGDDTIDGGGGFDRLRYDRSGVDGITADLAAGQVTGTWNGNAFTDTISNIEHLRGSNGDDVIGGNATDNQLDGRGGTDTFVHLGGADTISDFDAQTETLVVRVAGQSQATVDGAIATATDTADGALVNFGSGSVLFSGLGAADLSGADVKFMEPNGPNLVQGTDGNDTLVGTAGDDLVITGDNPGFDNVVASVGDDTFDFSGITSDPGGFVGIYYSGIGATIDVQVDGGANTGSVVKDGLGTDTFIDVEAPLLAGWTTGGLSIVGTSGDDTFDVSPEGEQWMSIQPGDGIDTIIVNSNGTERTDPLDPIGAVRLQMSDGFGIDVNLGTRMIADDGFGNAETIGGTAPVWEVFGSAGDDTFVGSDNAESFRSTGGDDTLDGGAGFDRVRYDSFQITSVDIDADAGTASGTLNGGGTFTDTISGFEHLRGSNGNDRIAGETGVDNRYEGRGGTDTFVHVGGNDTILDFDAQTETLIVRVAGLDQAQIDTAIAGATDQGNDALVSFGAGSVLFSGVTAADLASADVQFLDPAAATPPPPPPGPAAWTLGDPHLLTLDGLGYDFHAVGEYVLLRGQAGEDVGGFEIQSRMTPATDDQGAELDNVSVNAAIAMRAANGDAVMIDSTDAAPLSVGGVAQQLADGDMLDVGNDRIFRDGDTYTMVFAGADGALGEGDTQVAVVVHDARVDLSVRISADLAGRVEGLLGDGDGEIGNDIARVDGTALDRPLAFEDLYGGYRDDWRVDTEGDSLFTYDTGESLAGFYDPAKPGALTTLDDFEAGDLAAAQQAAEASGLTPGSVNYDNAVLDFLLTGDQGFIDSAASEDVAAPDTASTAPTLDVGQGRATLNINVTDRAGDAVEGASVGFTAGASTARSLADDVGGGAYALSVGDGASGQVGGTLGFTNAGEITAGDALEVLRIAVGLNPSWGPAQGLDFVAADLNGDARVTAGDALEVLRAAVGLDSEHAPEWVFINPDQDVSAASANDVPELGGVDIAAISGTQNVDMTAVLLGNMESFA